MRELGLAIWIWLFCFLKSIEGYRYVVTTYTGDRFGAGTDARVFVTLYGEKGAMQERELESKGRNNFERGQIDTFVVDSDQNLGRITRVNIRHDNSWLGPGWYLAKVTVTSQDGDYYEFPCEKWLDSRIEDGKTARQLIPRPTRTKISDAEPRQPLECSWPMGVGNGRVQDSQISASTSFNDMHLPFHGRLGKVSYNSLGGWCPYRDSSTEYLQVDFLTVKKFTGVATQGMGLVDEWTTAYRLAYANDSDGEWTKYKSAGNEVQDFLGNDDQNGTVLHWLQFPFVGRYVRVTPIEWHGKGCLRIDFYGCELFDAVKNTDKSGSLEVSAIKPPTTTPPDDEKPAYQPPELHQHPLPPPASMIASENKDEVHETAGSSRALSTSLEQKVGEPGEPTTIDVIPVLHLDFDEIRDSVIPDVSGHHNDAHLRKPVDIITFSKSCQRGLRLNGGDVTFDGEFLIDKPKKEITLAAWLKLFSNGGQHSIFDTVGGKDSSHREGQYHFEADRGHLRWFHRNEAGETVFNVSTGLMVPAHIWTHCSATYSSITGKAAIFVNGKLGVQGYGIGELSQDWSGRAGIGRHKGQRLLNGEIDDFYIFGDALSPTKIQLLMKRCSFETDCQQAIGMQSKEIRDSQITASSIYNLHKPFYGRINLASFWGDPARTAWCATKEDKSPYLEIDMGDVKSITGVATQGLSIFDNWVTSYLFCYSNDRALWSCYKEKGYDKIFEGNIDKNTIKRHYFHHTVDGRYVRIRPQSWYGNHLCMRVEVYGCTMDLLPDPFDSFGNVPNIVEDSEVQTRDEVLTKESCNIPLGVTNGEVDDIHVTASTSLDEDHAPFYGRLMRESMDQRDIRGCWCARDVNLRQFIEADLGEVKTITGIALQGYVSHDNWVASYRLGYSDENGPLTWYRENNDERIFVGNSDRSSIVKHYLKTPITARYLRINPRAWHGIHICSRFELFGCKEEKAHHIHNSPIRSEHQDHPIELLDAKDKASKDKHAHSGHSKSMVEHKGEHNHNKDPMRYLAEETKKQHPSVLVLEAQVLAHNNLHRNKSVMHHKTIHEHLNPRLHKPTYNEDDDDDTPNANVPFPTPKPFKVTSKPKQSISAPKLALNRKQTALNAAGHQMALNGWHRFAPGHSSLHQKQPLAAIYEKAKSPSSSVSSPPQVQQKAVEYPKVVTAPKAITATNANAVAAPKVVVTPNVVAAPNVIAAPNPVLAPSVAAAVKVAEQPKIFEASKAPAAIQAAGPEKSKHNSKPVTKHNIDAVAILQQYPELTKHGINEDTLYSLSERIPDLKERIAVHFANKYRSMMRTQPNVAASRFAMFKSFANPVNSLSQINNSPYNMASVSTLLPSQTKVMEDETQQNRNAAFFKQQEPQEPQLSQWGYNKDNKNTNMVTSIQPMQLESTTKLQEQISQRHDTKPFAQSPYSAPNTQQQQPQQQQQYTAFNNKAQTYQQPVFNYASQNYGQNMRSITPPIQTYGYGKEAAYGAQPSAIPYISKQPQQSISNQIYVPSQNQGEEGMPVVNRTSPGLSRSYVRFSPVGNAANAQDIYLPQSAYGGVFSTQWSQFSPCTVSCGRGLKRRSRKCGLPDCPTGGVEIESMPCQELPCPEAPAYSWSTFSPCSATCGAGKSVRYRLCPTQGCTKSGYQTEAVACYKPACPICLLDFETTEGGVIVDQSGLGNNAYLEKQAAIRPHEEMCGHYADLTGFGDILLVDRTFRGKPATGITIACWVNVQTKISGKHSIFSTVRMISPTNFIGGYHFELNDGRVRWFHRNENEKVVFSILTEPIAVAKVWMHYTATYDAYQQIAKVYVDGKEQASGNGQGMLSIDWGYKAAIGYYDFDDRNLNGWVDEFIIYDYALPSQQVFELIGKLRCATNSTTKEINAFRYQGINLNKRDLEVPSHKTLLKSNIDQSISVKRKT